MANENINDLRKRWQDILERSTDAQEIRKAQAQLNMLNKVPADNTAKPKQDNKNTKPLFSQSSNALYNKYQGEMGDLKSEEKRLQNKIREDQHNAKISDPQDSMNLGKIQAEIKLLDYKMKAEIALANIENRALIQGKADDLKKFKNAVYDTTTNMPYISEANKELVNKAYEDYLSNGTIPDNIKEIISVADKAKKDSSTYKKVPVIKSQILASLDFLKNYPDSAEYKFAKRLDSGEPISNDDILAWEKQNPLIGKESWKKTLEDEKIKTFDKALGETALDRFKNITNPTNIKIIESLAKNNTELGSKYNWKTELDKLAKSGEITNDQKDRINHLFAMDNKIVSSLGNIIDRYYTINQTLQSDPALKKMDKVALDTIQEELLYHPEKAKDIIAEYKTAQSNNTLKQRVYNGKVLAENYAKLDDKKIPSDIGYSARGKIRDIESANAKLAPAQNPILTESQKKVDSLESEKQKLISERNRLQASKDYENGKLPARERDRAIGQQLSQIERDKKVEQDKINAIEDANNPILSKLNKEQVINEQARQATRDQLVKDEQAIKQAKTPEERQLALEKYQRTQERVANINTSEKQQQINNMSELIKNMPYSQDKKDELMAVARSGNNQDIQNAMRQTAKDYLHTQERINTMQKSEIIPAEKVAQQAPPIDTAIQEQAIANLPENPPEIQQQTAENKLPQAPMNIDTVKNKLNEVLVSNPEVYREIMGNSNFAMMTPQKQLEHINKTLAENNVKVTLPGNLSQPISQQEVAASKYKAIPTDEWNQYANIIGKLNNSQISDTDRQALMAQKSQIEQKYQALKTPEESVMRLTPPSEAQVLASSIKENQANSQAQQLASNINEQQKQAMEQDRLAQVGSLNSQVAQLNQQSAQLQNSLKTVQTSEEQQNILNQLDEINRKIQDLQSQQQQIEVNQMNDGQKTDSFADEKGSKYIKKIGGKWRIISANTGKLWNAKYDTYEDALAGMRAYQANKGK